MATRGPKSSNTKGQISIMVGIMTMTFILFFAFVINTGMLVNAKINLQNAADLAAYAGAAVQARELTQISYLNYEMRRQWKKFLFRIYVVGNMSQDLFPRNGGSGPMTYIPNAQDPNDNYGIPSTCMVFNADDNYCHLRELPAISIPPASVLDSITDTLRDQLKAIEEIRQKNCQSIGQTNKMVNFYWLYNPDPFVTQFQNPDISSLTLSQVNVMKIIAGLVAGLGIVPREMLLKFRIKTLAEYVNAPPQLNVSLGSVRTLQNSADPSSRERTVQAFLSAYYTLGNHTFPGAKVIMDELLPQQLLKLQDIGVQFDTFTVDMKTGGSYGTASDTPGSCVGALTAVSVNQKLPVGVYKDPRTLTYYAIRLKAEAQLLFSPFGNIQMKAYAAAQPFGSRIGPPPSIAGFSFQTDAAGVRAVIPNLPVQESDGLPTKGTGWDRQEVVSLMYSKLIGNQAGTSQVTADALETAYHYAMAPNPWEKNKYNIFNDEQNDSFVRNFDNSDIAAIWAPIFPPDKVQQSSAEIKQAINELFNENVQGNAGSMPALQDTLQKGLERYIGQTLLTGGGENGESINIAKLSSPFKTGPRGLPITGDGRIILTDPRQFKSSWNTVNDGNIRAEGRVGYSVKFVAFDSLVNAKLPTNGTDTWSNEMPLDAESQFDVPTLRH